MLLIETIQLTNKQHAADLIYLLSDYALDPMGGAEALSSETKLNLVEQLKLRKDYVGWFALWNGKAVGLLNAFEGFSTFYAKPLLNIHDLAVLADFRGKGIANALMQQAEQYAKSNGCCKLTLEVLAENAIAKSLYHKQGYAPYQLAENAGVAEFWQKNLAQK